MFIGHEYELKELEELYKEPGFQVAVVTGTRCSGKTTLLKEFTKDKKTLFFTAFETTGEQEISLLSKYVSRLNGKDYSKLEDVTLLKLFDDIIDESSKERLVFVIDEYAAFARADASFEGLFTTYLKERFVGSDILLIISGTRSSYFNKHCLGDYTPVGKFTEIKLGVESINYMDALKYCKNADNYTRAILYGITGGMPALLSRYRDGETVKEFVIREYLDPSATYFALTQDMLAFDLRELSYYNRMLGAIAHGLHRVNEISAEVGKPKDVVVPYLNTLISLGLVERTNPLTEETNRKKTRYMIINSYVEFYFRFVAPNLDMVYSGEADKLFDVKISPFLDLFMAGTFPKMCRDYLEKKCSEDSKDAFPFEIEKVGRWWQNAGEKEEAADFDLLAISDRAKKCTVYCSCIFGKNAVELITLKELIGMTTLLRRDGDVYYMVFAAGDFHQNTITVASTIKNIVLVRLDELYTDIG